MPTKRNRRGDVLELRRQAEESALRGPAPAPTGALSAEALRQTLQELRVHQIELEMQNEELRRAQDELDTAAARFFDFYDLAPVGYVTVAESGVIRQANLTTAKLLGVPRAELVGQPLARFISPEDQDGYHLLRRRILGAAGPQTRELRLVRHTGTLFWAQVVAVAALDEDGAPAWRVVLSDITERKQAQAERERLEAQQRQVQKAESLARMGGAIAHNFNNLLHAVMMSLELAKGDLALDAAHDENLDSALHSARKAAQVSSLMLTCLGQTLGKREALDLAALCQAGLPVLREALSVATELEADLPAPGPSVGADATQIQQVLAQLVTNAREALGDARGRIGVVVGMVDGAALPAANRFPVDFRPAESAYAWLEVSDTGCGIADRDLERLFDPFFTSKFAGRGLGLAVVLGIVRAHEGAVTVQSELGRGSVFRVYLPMAATAASVRPVPPGARVGAVAAEPGAESARAVTVLVAEDVPAVRRAVVLVLRRLGFSVLTADDGVEAVEVFRRHAAEICCVLCDLTMPRMNGWETLAALRQIAPGLPVILTSGYKEDQAMAGEHREQPQAFMSKPYTPEALVGAIAQALAQRSG